MVALRVSERYNTVQVPVAEPQNQLALTAAHGQSPVQPNPCDANPH